MSFSCHPLPFPLVLHLEPAGAVKDRFALRQADLLAVRGKAIPVRVCEAVGRTGDVAADALERIAAYNEALAHYTGRRFTEAAGLRAARRRRRGYVKRCRRCQDPGGLGRQVRADGEPGEHDTRLRDGSRGAAAP
jgi:hypothetical protein